MRRKPADVREAPLPGLGGERSVSHVHGREPRNELPVEVGEGLVGDVVTAGSGPDHLRQDGSLRRTDVDAVGVWSQGGQEPADLGSVLAVAKERASRSEKR